MPTNLADIADHTCLVYLIRHGATNNNLSKPPRLQGNGVDSALSPTGERQAQLTAKSLSKQSLHAVYSSPLLRARQTADSIAAPHDQYVRIDRDLSEVDVGDWEGKTWPDIQRDFPEAYQSFFQDPAQHGYLGGENLSQVQARASAALRKIVQSHLGEQIAIVAHSIVNRTILVQVLGLSLEDVRSVTQDNCGINVLRYRNDKLKLCTMNSIFHLIE